MKSHPIPTAEQSEAINRITDKFDSSLSSTIMEEAGVSMVLGCSFLAAHCKKDTQINALILWLSVAMVMSVTMFFVAAKLLLPLGIFACFVLTIIVMARKKTIGLINSSKKDIVIASGYWKDNEDFFLKTYNNEECCKYRFKAKVSRLADLFENWEFNSINYTDIGSLLRDLCLGEMEKNYQEKIDKIGVSNP